MDYNTKLVQGIVGVSPLISVTSYTDQAEVEIMQQKARLKDKAQGDGLIQNVNRQIKRFADSRLNYVDKETRNGCRFFPV